MKKLLTGLLVAGILVLSTPQCAAPETPTPQPEMFLQCVVAVLVIAVGTVCIIGIVKCCKILNQLDPPAPPVLTNNIPTNNIPTNYPPVWTNPPLASYPLSIVTTNRNFTFQQRLGQSNWMNVSTVTLTNDGDSVVLQAAGLCMTSSVVNGVAVFFLPPVEDPAPGAASRFFRLLSTP